MRGRHKVGHISLLIQSLELVQGANIIELPKEVELHRLQLQEAHRIEVRQLIKGLPNQDQIILGQVHQQEAILHQVDLVAHIAGVQLQQGVVAHIAEVLPRQEVAVRTADHLHPYQEAQALQGDRQEAEVQEGDNHYISTQQREHLAPFFYVL
jgi:hypothetical protein